VILEVQDRFQRDPDALSRLWVRGNAGQLVPLSAVAEITRGVGPLTVNHFGQLPAVTLSFNLNPGYAIGDAVDRVTAVARETLPASITTNFQGRRPRSSRRSPGSGSS